jgi:serine/threonine-protein kinase ULK/ATG1
MAGGGNMPPPQQPKLDEYYLGKELGRGSFAKVYLAVHETTRESRAVKKIDRTRLSAKLLSNLESEISILRDFQHENIVKLDGIKKTREHIYLVLEFCSGGDLHKYIKQCGRLPEPVAQRFMGHLASGLVFLWKRQLIHRDIKPQK